MRDELHLKIIEHENGVINLDVELKELTYWVCYRK